MKNSFNFRKYKTRDIKDILEIYNFYIINGLSNFEENPLSYKDFDKLCNYILYEKLPFIVCLKNDKVVGFSFLTKFRNKSGYRFAFENSVYIHQNYVGMGVGSQLLSKLIKLSSKNRNIKTIIAVITNNSIASIKIHEKNGFDVIGCIKKVGFKKNQWLDALYMQKSLHKNEKN